MKNPSSFGAVALSLWLCLFASNADLAAAEPLENYLGDWLFRGDRKQVWTGVEDEANGGLILHEYYNALCGPVRRRWTVHYDRDKAKYVGTLKTSFGREARETQVIGDWNAQETTMTWVLEKDTLDAEIRHKFSKGKLTVASRRIGDNVNGVSWYELGTLSPTAR